jgi:transposase
MSDSPITSPFAPDVERVRAWLEQMIATLRFVELVKAILVLLTRMAQINAELTHRLHQARRGRPRSETLARLERQLVLPFMDVLGPAAPSTPEKEDATDEPKNKPRRGRHPGRAPLPAHLERVVETNAVPPELRACPKCGREMTTVSHSICEILDVIPARFIVRERHDETVACPHDDTIVSASPPAAIVERGKLGDTLLIEAVADKYIQHQPLERQCTRFARAGVPIAHQTLSRGVCAVIDLLVPVANRIAEATRGPGLLGTDATGIPILDRDARDGVRNGVVWCWTNAAWVSFEYSPVGDADSVRRFLGDDLARDVQCDGANVFNFLERAGGKRPGCWAHGRRRFVEAAKAGDLIARDALRIIARLFAVERASTLAGETADQRLARRVECSQPIVDELRIFLDHQRAVIPPKTPLGRALGYLHRQWRRLLHFLEDGNIELTNNRRERELRGLVLGRKNWLFAWGDVGGERTCAILTIVATCLAHQVDPRAYLHRVAKRIVDGWPQSKLRELLPDRMLAAHPELGIGERDPAPS